jgi:aconitate hydratase
VGFKLSGELPEGVTATDLVLTITEMLRKHGSWGKFVEFYGPACPPCRGEPSHDRQHVAGVRLHVAVFPVDDETISYLRLTGRPDSQLALVEAYAKEQGIWHDPDREPRYSEYLELDLGTIVPSIAGPKRPQDRVALSDAKERIPQRARRVRRRAEEQDEQGYDRASAESFPASDPPSYTGENSSAPPHERAAGGTGGTNPAGDRVSKPTPVTSRTGTTFELDHGAVAIAAITSCTTRPTRR